MTCGNARFHTAGGSKPVRQSLEEWGDRVVLHYLPAYPPNDNPVERAWWGVVGCGGTCRRGSPVTRNHRCNDTHEPLNLTLDWVEDRGRFKVHGRMYRRLKQRFKRQAEAQAEAQPATG